MAVDRNLLGCSVLLAAVCIYGLVTKAIDGKIWATLGYVLFLAAGVLGAASASMNTNNDLRNYYNHAFFVSQTAGVDFLMTDICILSGVDKNLALLNLVPPAVDIVMKYFVDSNFNVVTPMTHIVSMGLMCFFGYRDQKYVLFAAAVGFLLAIARLWNKNEEKTWLTHAYNAVGVFFVGWFLAGKDLKDLGIPIS